MKTKRMYMLSLATAALLVITGFVTDADAKARTKQKSRTSNVQVYANRQPSYNIVPQRQGSVQNHQHGFKMLSKQDRKIVRRLAKYTGVSKRRLVQLRLRGMQWRQIARRLDIPRRAVFAARDARSWKRFLRHQQSCVSFNIEFDLR